MIIQRRARAVPLALTGDRRINARVLRLVAVSAVALGLIWALARTTLDLPGALSSALAIGWALMPLVLATSLAAPRLRYLLTLPASLESGALLALLIGWRPADPLPAVGWVLITAGVLVGGTLGLWLWYRLLPVPAWLDDPSAAARWGLIGVHVALVTAGMLLASTPLWSG